jgi:uncharacterized membrane protein
VFKNIDFQKWKMRLIYLICFLFFLGGSWALSKSYTTIDPENSSEEVFKERLILVCSTLFFTGCGLFLYFLNKENEKENKFISYHLNPIIIRGSYSKNLLLLFSCIFFIVICIPLTIYPEEFDFGNNYEKIVIGIAGLLFFGFGLIVSFLKLFNNNSTIEINERGFIINGGVFKSKIFYWKDIDFFNEIIIKNNKFINVALRNPKDYIDTQNYWIKRKFYRIIYATSKTLISITSSNFDIGHQQLLDLLNYKLNQFKEKK